MLRIYLARHGQNADNAEGILNGHRDRPLTRIGITQARLLSEMIKERGLAFDAVYSSPLSRAYETAEIITDALQTAKPTKLQGLIERDFGVMTGKPVADIEKLHPAEDIIKSDPITYFLSPKDGESFPQVLERARALLDWLDERHSEGSVLLVGHGDIGKMLYAAYYDLDWKEILTMFHFGNSDILLLSETSPAEETHVFAAAQHNH